MTRGLQCWGICGTLFCSLRQDEKHFSYGLWWSHKHFDKNTITFELLDQCVGELKPRRADRPDGLMLIPVRVIICAFYFEVRLFTVCPPRVCSGNNCTVDLGSTHNYGGMTLTQVISKLFESILPNKCSDHLLTVPVTYGSVLRTLLAAPGCSCITNGSWIF